MLAPMSSPSYDPTLHARALITGATAGIGHEFAVQLAGRGHDLVLVARDRDRLDAVAAELSTTHGVEVEVMAVDLTDREQLVTVEARLSSTENPVGLLVNNAGFGLKQRFGANDVEAEQAMLDVLVTAVMRLSHASLNAMSRRGRGGVINVSSVAAFLPRGTYSAAKAYVNSFGRWAHHEYKAQGVMVTTLCPGFTKTEFHQRMQVKRGNGVLWLDVEQLVAQCLSDHARGKAFSIPTTRYRAIVLLARLVPASVLQKAQSLGRR